MKWRMLSALPVTQLNEQVWILTRAEARDAERLCPQSWLIYPRKIHEVHQEHQEFAQTTHPRDPFAMDAKQRYPKSEHEKCTVSEVKFC